MAYTPAWRNFKRMQDLTVAAASLIYAAAVIDSYDRLPGNAALTVSWTLLWPAAYLGFSLAAPLLIPPIRRWLAKYVWMSFQMGFGQSAGSVAVGMALLLGAGVFIHQEIARVIQTGQLGVNVFSCYAAGIGILAAQAIVVRALEQVPDIRRQIEQRD